MIGYQNEREFLQKVSSIYPTCFGKGNLVVAIGSISRSIAKEVLRDCKVISVDLENRIGVDIVSKCRSLKLPSKDPEVGKGSAPLPEKEKQQCADVIMWLSGIEDDKDFVESIKNLTSILKTGGVFILSCTSNESTQLQRSHHSNEPSVSGGKVNCRCTYKNYYKPVTFEDISKSIPLDALFNDFHITTPLQRNVNNTKENDLTQQKLDRKYDYHNKTTWFYGLRNESSIDTSFWNRPNECMEKIFEKHKGTTRGESKDGFVRQYSDILDKFRYRSDVRFLEIGTDLTPQTPNLLAMREYLKSASVVIGVNVPTSASNFDFNYSTVITERPPKLYDVGNSIYVEDLPLKKGHETQGQVQLKLLYRQIANKYGEPNGKKSFDIVIDSGTHIVEDVILHFEALFPLLGEGGVYIIENTAVVNQIGNFRRHPNTSDHLSYFATLSLTINNRDEETGRVNQDKVPVAPTKPEIETCVDSILFGCAFICVTKRTRRPPRPNPKKKK